MDEPIENLYFNWLYAKVASVDVPPTPTLSFLTLMRVLHSVEFVWLVSGDDNREEDGRMLRKEFLTEAYLEADHDWFDYPSSVLEMLIAFSRRAAFEIEFSPREWFWIFLTNLGLNDLNDASLGVAQKTEAVLETFLWRTYSPDGSGGLFPLQQPPEDQRQVEIWYQFCEWLIDQDL
jgi:hypothetical protein